MANGTSKDVAALIDQRLSNVEQVLPTLPTRTEMREAIAVAVAPLATKEERRQAIAPLATKEEIASLPTKKEMAEAISADKLLAEGLVATNERMDRGFEEVRGNSRTTIDG